MILKLLRYPSVVAILFALALVLLTACGPTSADEVNVPSESEQDATTSAEEITSSDTSASTETQSSAAKSVEEPTTAGEAEAESTESNNSDPSTPDSSTTDEESPASTIDTPLVASAPSGKSLQPQLAEADIDLDKVVTLLPPDAIRAVAPSEVSQIMVTAQEAEADGIDPDVRVIGVSINGESHAYPIPFLSRHEIVNAELGGTLIATTW